MTEVASSTAPQEGAIITWYLDYQGAPLPLPDWPVGVSLIEAEVASPELSQFLFCAVGQHWRWYSRLSWDYAQWLAYLTSKDVRTWVLYQRGTPAGFVELVRHLEPTEGRPSVELKFFGLLPAFIGQGLGALLAQAAVALAQQWLADTEQARVWLHTCSADHPSALRTYQQAGFVIIASTSEDNDIPADYATAALAAPFVHSRLLYFKR